MLMIHIFSLSMSYEYELSLSMIRKFELSFCKTFKRVNYDKQTVVVE